MEIDETIETTRVNDRESWNQSSFDISIDVNPAGILAWPQSTWEGQGPRAALKEPPAWLSFTSGRKTSPQKAGPVSKSSLSVTEFVKHCFLPEHVALKRSAGRAHFYAILKHLLPPEEVNRIAGRAASNDRSKLLKIPGWPYIGNRPLCEVDSESIQRLVSMALERGYSIQTATHMRNVVRSIFSHAARTGHYTGLNPALPVVLPAMSRREAHSLSLSQVSYLLHAMGYPERNLALFSILVEMGVAEICGLQWKHLNLANTSQKPDLEVIPPATIAVRKQWYRGELAHAVGSRRRFIRISPPLHSLLRELKQRNQFNDPDDFVLVSRKGTPIHPENIAARRLKALGSSFGMPWLSWSVFQRTGNKLRDELGRSFDDGLEKLVSALGSPTY